MMAFLDTLDAVADASKPLAATGRRKCESIARLEESALRLFSKHGFEGASLRDIAHDANVPLSTIDRYFGSKLDLLNEIKSSIWKQINAEREALLKASADVEAGRPTLRAVLYAFVHPVVRRSLGEERSTLSLRLLRECVALDVHSGSTNAPEWIANVANRWIGAILAAQPNLTRDQAVWLFSFVVMTTFSEQMQYGWYDRLRPADSRMSAADLTRMIVDFCQAGIGAVADREGVEETRASGTGEELARVPSTVRATPARDDAWRRREARLADAKLPLRRRGARALEPGRV